MESVGKIPKKVMVGRELKFISIRLMAMRLMYIMQNIDPAGYIINSPLTSPFLDFCQKQKRFGSFKILKVNTIMKSKSTVMKEMETEKRSPDFYKTDACSMYPDCHIVPNE